MAFDPAFIFAAVPVITTERLRLRELLPSDAPALFKIYSNATVGRFNRWKIMTEEAEAVAKIAWFREHFEEKKRVRWGLEWQESGEIVGDVVLLNFDERANSAEIGFNLGEAQWRKGLMREAVSAVLAHGFAHYDLHRVQALVVSENTASTGLLQRLGFQKEGYLREAGRIRGTYVDLEVWGLLAREWSD